MLYLDRAAQGLPDDLEHEQRQQLDAPSAPQEALAPRPAVRQPRPQEVVEERPAQPGAAPHRPVVPHAVCFHRARQKVEED